MTWCNWVRICCNKLDPTMSGWSSWHSAWHDSVNRQLSGPRLKSTICKLGLRNVPLCLTVCNVIYFVTVRCLYCLLLVLGVRQACAQMRAGAFKCKCKCKRRIKCKCKCFASESNASANANAQQTNQMQMQMHLNQMQMHLNQMHLYEIQMLFFNYVVLRSASDVLLII